MKSLRPGTWIHVKDNASGRIRHARVVTVTNQNSITVKIGQNAPVAATRGASTTTRGTIFTTA